LPSRYPTSPRAIHHQQYRFPPRCHATSADDNPSSSFSMSGRSVMAARPLLDLPEELLSSIASCLPTASDCLNLSLCCKTLQRITAEHLYREFRLTSGDDSTATSSNHEKLKDCVILLLDHPSIAKHFRKLVVYWAWQPREIDDLVDTGEEEFNNAHGAWSPLLILAGSAMLYAASWTLSFLTLRNKRSYLCICSSARFPICTT